MSEAMKPTPGPWHADQRGNIWRRHPSELYENGGGVAGDKPVATTHKGWFGEGEEGYPVEDNARLIAEAGTVFHETGLSPRQILEQRAELLAACQKMAEWEACEKDYSIGFMERIDLCNEAFNMMRAAIAKCEVTT